MFFTEEILDDIVSQTNRNVQRLSDHFDHATLQRILENRSRFSHIQEVNKVELLAYIGLSYCLAVQYLNMFIYNQIWR